MNRSVEFYLLILSRLLLEIRNLENSDIDKAKSLAYIFHNVPGMLRLNYSEEAAERAFQVIKSRAEHFGLLEWIEEWESSAFERLKWEQAKKGINQSD